MRDGNWFDYEWFDDEDGVHVAQVRYHYTAGCGANTSYGHPDNYSPAEPSEIDVVEIVVDGQVLDREAEAAFLDRHGDSLYEKIDEHHNTDYGEE